MSSSGNRRRAPLLAGVSGLALVAAALTLWWSTWPAELPARPAAPPAPATAPTPALLPALAVPAALAGADPAVQALAADARRGVEAAPHDAEAWLRLGMVYEANDFDIAALPCYEQAIALGTGNPRWLYRLALVRHHVGDLDGAFAALAQAAAADDAYAPLHWRRGLWLLDGGDLAAAEASFRQAIQVDPFDNLGDLGLARTLLAMRRDGEALGLLESLRVARDDDPYLHLLLGTAHRQLGNLEAAAYELGRGLGAEPRWHDPWQQEVGRFRPGFATQLKQGIAALERGEPAVAVDLLAPLAEQNPADVTVANNLVAAYLRVDRTADAIATLEGALTRYPDHFALHLNASVAYEKAGNVDRALVHAERAIALNPTLGRGYERRALLQRRQRSLEAAVDSFALAIRYDPANPRLHLWKGELELHLSRFNDAVRSLEAGTRLDGRDAHAFASLGLARVAVGAFAEAATALAKAEALAPSGAPQIQRLRSELAARRAAAKLP